MDGSNGLTVVMDEVELVKNFLGFGNITKLSLAVGSFFVATPALAADVEVPAESQSNYQVVVDHSATTTVGGEVTYQESTNSQQKTEGQSVSTANSTDTTDSSSEVKNEAGNNQTKPQVTADLSFVLPASDMAVPTEPKTTRVEVRSNPASNPSARPSNQKPIAGNYRDVFSGSGSLMSGIKAYNLNQTGDDSHQTERSSSVPSQPTPAKQDLPASYLYSLNELLSMTLNPALGMFAGAAAVRTEIPGFPVALSVVLTLLVVAASAYLSFIKKSGYAHAARADLINKIVFFLSNRGLVPVTVSTKPSFLFVNVVKNIKTHKSLMEGGD